MRSSKVGCYQSFDLTHEVYPLEEVEEEAGTKAKIGIRRTWLLIVACKDEDCVYKRNFCTAIGREGLGVLIVVTYVISSNK